MHSTALDQLRSDAACIFRAGLEAVDAEGAVLRHIRLDSSPATLHLSSGESISLANRDRILVIGAGKAAAPMAAALERVLAPAFRPEGVVVVKYGHTTPRPDFIRLHEAGHPLPDPAGLAGSVRIEQLLAGVTARDIVFVLLSGGASALLPAPASGISLAEKQETTNLLLRAGADIFELNAVRKHLSRFKGGQLAALAQPATIITLILSDVIGDRLDVIGSGVTSPDPSTFAEAEAVLRRYGVLERVPASVRDRLARGRAGEVSETPKSFESYKERVYNVVIASNRLAIEAASERAQSLGYRTIILTSTLQGEAREVARVHAEILREAVSSGHPIAAPGCLLSGGETTVTVKGSGKGGRNQEFALAAAIAIAALPGAVILAAGTDGTDGPTDAAGAIVDGTTAARALAGGFDPLQALASNDSYTLLSAVDDLLKTGSTGTNVMDMNVMLLGQSPPAV